MSDLDVGIVHEWLTNWAGSERCVDALRDAFPRHRVYASVINEELFPEWVGTTTTSFLQHIPPLRRSHLYGLPAVPLAMRRVRIEPHHDLVIRSFHTFATIPRPTGVPEIVYCHTPPRFLYRGASLRGEHPLVRTAIALAGAPMRRGDQARMRRQEVVVANSRHTADRIREVYGLDAEVIHPPVDIDRFTAAAAPRGGYYVLFGRLVAYKRPELVIEAFRTLPFELRVVGDGRMRKMLEHGAPPNVTFLGHVPDGDAVALLAAAQGAVFAGEEDFGIAPVEALAAGTPVITYGAGGALDYVEHGHNGWLVTEQTPQAFALAVRESDGIAWDPEAIHDSSRPFSRARFMSRMTDLATRTVARARS